MHITINSIIYIIFTVKRSEALKTHVLVSPPFFSGLSFLDLMYSLTQLPFLSTSIIPREEYKFRVVEACLTSLKLLYGL